MLKIIHTELKSASRLNQSYRRSLSLFYSRIYEPSTHGTPFISSTDIDDLLERVAQLTDIDWCVVHGEGTIYLDQQMASQLYRSHIQALPEETLVTGHLINKGGHYCGLHEQAFAINIKQYKRLGKPKFGQHEASAKCLCDYQPGESYHDGYTPKEVLPLLTQSEYRFQLPGWNMVHSSIEAGLPVYNFSQELRDSKLYIYPENQTEKFNQCLQHMFDLDVPNEIQQRRALVYMLKRKLGLSESIEGKGEFYYRPRKMSVFMYNTEHLLPEPDWYKKTGFKFDHFIGPANGLVDIANMAMGLGGPEVCLAYYDVNTDALDYKKFFWENIVPGDVASIISVNDSFKDNYPNISIDDRAMDRCLGHLELCLQQSEYRLAELIEVGKRAQKTYHRINIIDEPEGIWSLVSEQSNTFLSISDIFLGQNELLYGFENLSARFVNFIERASSHDRLVIHGKSLFNDKFILDYASDVYLKQRGLAQATTYY
jgi:hypothetical protein